MSTARSQSRLAGRRAHQVAIFVAMYLGYAMYTATRKSFSYVMPFVIEERPDIDRSQLGLIQSSITLSYGLSKFSVGVFADRSSARLVFSAGLLICGLVTALFACFDSVPVYALLWFLNGLFQGCGWPACAKILRQWYRPDQFGTWWSVLSTSGNLANTIAPLAASYVALHQGWKLTLQIQGVLAIAMAAVALMVIRNRPADFGLPSIVNENVSQKSSNDEPSLQSAVLRVVRSPFLWVMLALYSLVELVAVGSVTWSQLYLLQQRHLPLYLGTAYVSSLQFGAIVGSLLVGYVTDRQVSKHGIQPRGSARYPVLIALSLLLTFALHLFTGYVHQDSPPWWVLVVGFLVGGSEFAIICVVGIIPVEHSSAELSGTTYGVISLGSKLGSTLAGFPLSYIASRYDWSSAFHVLEVISILLFLITILTYNIPSQIGIKTKRNV